MNLSIWESWGRVWESLGEFGSEPKMLKKYKYIVWESLGKFRRVRRVSESFREFERL